MTFLLCALCTLGCCEWLCCLDERLVRSWKSCFLGQIDRLPSTGKTSQMDSFSAKYGKTFWIGKFSDKYLFCGIFSNRLLSDSARDGTVSKVTHSYSIKIPTRTKYNLRELLPSGGVFVGMLRCFAIRGDPHLFSTRKTCLRTIFVEEQIKYKI